MKVVICGDRHWRNGTLIKECLELLPPGTLVITGAAKGADTIAHNLAHEMGFLTMRYFPDWDRRGLAAGPIRNASMLDENPDIVIAFHNDLSKSKGTKDCVDQARRRGIPVEIVSED